MVGHSYPPLTTERHRRIALVAAAVYGFLFLVIGYLATHPHPRPVRFPKAVEIYIPIPDVSENADNDEIPLRSSVSPPSTSTSTMKSDLESDLLRGKVIIRNPFSLTKDEILEQLESAKVPSLKMRVKRFACWHSCFGPFRKKVMRRQYTVKSTTAAKPSSTVKPITGIDTKKQKGEGSAALPSSIKKTDNNELGDGADEVPQVLINLQNNRAKKEASPLDYFKLKTRVVRNKQTSESSAKSSSSAASDGSGTTKDGADAAQQKPAEVKNKKKGSTFGSYVKKKKVKTTSVPKTPPPSSTTTTTTSTTTTTTPTTTKTPSPASPTVAVAAVNELIKVESVESNEEGSEEEVTEKGKQKKSSTEKEKDVEGGRSSDEESYEEEEEEEEEKGGDNKKDDGEDEASQSGEESVEEENEKEEPAKKGKPEKKKGQ